MSAFGPAFDSAAFDADAGTRLPLRVQVCAHGASSLPMALQSIPADLLNGDQTLADLGTASSAWRPRVLLDGVDMADIVVGAIEIQAEEGAARIASLTLCPSSGTVLDLPSWTGRPVSIDFAGVSGGSLINPIRLFTGVIELPSFDPLTGLVKITATDDLQGVCRAMTNDAIDSLVGGRWSPAVFDEAASVGWQRVQDRLSTVRAALDLDVWRRPRLTPWAGSVQLLEIWENQIEDGSLSVDLAERSTLINRIDINFTYRFPLLCRLAWPVSVDFIETSGAAGFADFVNEGRKPLPRESVASAFKNAGVYAINMTYTALPTVPIIVGGGFWIPNPATDPLLCLGFDATIGFDFSRTRDEVSSIRVECAASVAAIGPQASTMSDAIENDSFDAADWEQRRWQLANGENTAFVPVEPPAAVIGRIAAAPAPATTANDRAAATAAQETLIDIAKTTIAASHRRNRVGFAVPLNAAIDLDRHLRIVTDRVVATGKVQAITHTLDTDSGRAASSVVLAVSSLNGVGFTHPETVTAASESVVTPGEYSLVPSVAYDSLIGEATFELTFPGLTDAERDTETVALSSVIDATISEDELILTA